MSVDYSKMGSWYRIESWTSAHPLDADRFYEALAEIIDDPDFNVENLRSHLEENAIPKGWDAGADVEELIDRWCDRADSIYGYLKKNRLL